MPSTILRPYFLSIRNRIRFREREAFGLSRELLMLFVALVIMVCIFAAVSIGLKALAQNSVFVVVLPPKLIELSLHYFFILLVVSNTVAATGNIYTSDRMNLLLVAPIPPLRLFFAKFLETLIETGIMFYVFTLPVVLAFIVRLDASPTLFLAYLALSIPFLVCPVALGIVLATFFSRIISFFWRRGGTFVILAFLTFGYGLIRLSSELRVARDEGKAAHYLASFAGLYGNPSPYYLPSRWISDVLSGFIGNQVVHSSEKVILLFTTAVGLTAIAFLVFDLFMFRVRSASLVSEHIDESAPGVRFRRDVVRRGLERIVGLFYRDQQVRAIVLKDLTSLLRDRTQALQLMLYLGIATLYVTVFYFMSFSLRMELVAQQTWRATLATLNVLFSGLIFTTILTRIVYPSVSLEGRSFWILQVTPIEVRRLLRAKLLCWLPVTTLMFVSLLCAGAIAIGTEWNYLFYVVTFGTALSIGYTGLAIGLGARFAVFDWESPNQLAVGVGTLVLLLSGITLLFTMTIPTGIITFLVVIPDLQSIIGRGVAFAIMAGMLALSLFINIMIANYACRKGAKSLAGRKSPNS